MTYRLNFAKPVTLAHTPRVPSQHPVYGLIWREIPLSEGTGWTDPHFGWPLVVTAIENDGHTLVLEAKRPAALGGAS